MLTPMNVKKKCALAHFGLILALKIRGNQCVIPAIIANTAPMEST